MSLFLNVFRCVLLSSKKKLRLNPMCIEELIKTENKGKDVKQKKSRSDEEKN